MSNTHEDETKKNEVESAIQEDNSQRDTSEKTDNENPSTSEENPPKETQEETSSGKIHSQKSQLWEDGTPPHRHPILGDDELMKTFVPGMFTLNDCFDHAAQSFVTKDCLGVRPLLKMHQEEIVNDEGEKKVHNFPELGAVKWMSYSEIHNKIANLSSGIAEWTGLKFGQKLGIYCNTRYEWFVCAHACFRRGIVVATAYANLGEEALVHIINQCKLTTMFVSAENVPNLVKLKDQIKTLKYIIYVDDLKEKPDCFECRSFQELIHNGQEKPVEVEKKPTGDDLCVIMYTSGSTGTPKGVMVRHVNLLSAAAGVSKLMKADALNDVYIAYLPLAHILELAVECGLNIVGVKMAYGNPRTLIERGVRNCQGDIAEVRPTILVGVPRVFSTIMKGAREKIHESGKFAEFVFKNAFLYQSHYIRTGQKPSKILNHLVFNKLQKRLGGRMRLIVSGGAPLSSEIHEFLKTTFNNCGVIQGYGLTETCGGGTVQDPDQYKPGNVGYPVPSCEVRLVDCPEMGYTHKDKPNPRGEIAIRGYNVTPGYYQGEGPEPDGSISEDDLNNFRDGWFYTGDIGVLNEDGTISIIDRKKNLIKMSHGEYVALEKLEMVYGDSYFVAPNGISVYGDSSRHDLVALIVPNEPYILRWAKRNGKPEDMSKLVKDDELRQTVVKDLKAVAHNTGRKSFEHVKDVFLCPEEWTPENGMLTSAMKLKRSAIYKRYEEEIDAMYKRLKD